MLVLCDCTMPETTILGARIGVEPFTDSLCCQLITQLAGVSIDESINIPG